MVSINFFVCSLLSRRPILLPQGRARGDLYIDDYQSFDYRQGAYIHREFVLEDGQLTSKYVVNTHTLAAINILVDSSSDVIYISH